MKAIEQYFHVVLFMMLCKVILTFRFVHEALVCDNLNQKHYSSALLLRATVYYAMQRGYNLRVY